MQPPGTLATPDNLADLREKPPAPRPADTPGGTPVAANWLTTLDALRGLAAFYVVCHHARVLLLVSREEARLGPPVAKAMAAAGAGLIFGHQAVIFFFVLSGFCIHFRQAKTLGGPSASTFRFDAPSYFWRRLRRIVPPFYFALLLTAILNAATRWVNPAIVERGVGNEFANLLLSQNNDLGTLLGNLLFLQWLVVPTFGNNTALWSLAYEFYLYALYPPYLLIRRALGVWGSTAAVLAVSASMLALVRLRPGSDWGVVPILEYWACWVFGATAAEVYLGRVKIPTVLTTPWFAAAAIAGWLATVRTNLGGAISDTIGAAACCLLLLCCLCVFRVPPARGLARAVFAASSRLGRFSYSLYLVHIPVLALACALWFRNHDAMPQEPWVWAAGVLASLAAGWAAFWAVERRFLRS